MPTPPTLELTRHYHTLSEREVDEVVQAVADLIVTFLTGRRDPEQSAKRRQARTRERHVAQQPKSR